MLEKLFKLKENNTTVKTELMAGITTFMTMAYILAVNPNILGTTGMDANAVLMATALASFIGCLLMGFLANYPFALAPGMGLNAYFAFSVCQGYGVSWHVALAAVLVEGIIFIILSLTNVREALFNAIPLPLKHAVGAGIGLFIAFIGLQGSRLVVADNTTLLTYQHFKDNFSTDSIRAVLCLIGIIVTVVLAIKHVKGSILWGILITWILGIICEKIGWYTPTFDSNLSNYSVIPEFTGFHLDSIRLTFGQAFNGFSEFNGLNIINFIVIVFAFLFVDLFDTLGTLIGVSSKADMLDKDGKLPRIKGALLADAIATCTGAVLGTSTTTTFVESASGVTEGGRTGLTAITTGFLFLACIFLAPLFTAIPSFATAPALIVVGFYMISSVVKINFDDMCEGIPAFLCIVCMPLMYSIAEGISIGVISYTIITLLTGKAKEKKLSWIMYVLTLLFIAKYVIYAICK